MPVRQRVLFASVAVLAAVAFVAHAAEPEDIIKYRKQVMKSQGAHMAAAAAIIQGKVDFKNQLAGHVKALQETTRDIPAMFPKGSDFGDTDALDSVWQKHDEFLKRAKNAREKADALAKVVAAGNTKEYAERFKELSDGCKSCHKDFRKEEK